MEAAFGTSFAGVRAHLGGAQAQEGLAALGANAAASGESIAFRDSNPADELIAHVVQRGVGIAARGDVQLARVETAGGWWEFAGQPNGLGAIINLSFDPGEPVDAEQIGLVQTVTTERREKGPTKPDLEPARNFNEETLQLGGDSSDPGRMVDQRPNNHETLPNTNPLYTTANAGPTPGTNLSEPKASDGLGQHGHRFRKDNKIDKRPATMTDRPGRLLKEDALWHQRFEVAAFAFKGVMAGTYLGSVNWGWSNDTNDRVMLDPLTVAGEGAPSTAMLEAIQRWNESLLLDTKTEKLYETVDLPIPGANPESLPTYELERALVRARAEAEGATGEEKVRKDFAERVLTRELQKRTVEVSVKLVATADEKPQELFVTLVQVTASRRNRHGPR